ncbi:MAG: SagB/ThcOx family dehydrogenase [Gaiellaceae bacterium]
MAGPNWDTAAARRYHEGTKHSYESVRRGARPLDWANRPHPFKDYVGLEPEPLPPGELGWLLRWGAGVARTRSYGADTYHFRTYSSAGALYPVEVYVADRRGLWHFHPLERALRRLRDVDVRSRLADAETVVVLTGILWRTAWKYGTRGYRHLFWDAGTMLANLLELAGAVGIEAHVVTGFVDADVNHVVGVDGEREAALALLALSSDPGLPRVERLPRLELAAEPLSRHEGSCPEAQALHEASSLATVEEVRRYQEPQPEAGRIGLSREELERVLRRRGSVREFALEAVPAGELSAILAGAEAPVAADVPAACELYVIASGVEGLAPGAHRFEPPDRFELLRAGTFRAQAGYLALEQPLGARAAATCFFLADLDEVLERHGNRGYRAAQLEGGIRTGRIYLGAVARGLGVTASTFYDDEVTAFFAPGTPKAPLLCAAIGRG